MNPEVVVSNPTKTQKTEKSNLHEFEAIHGFEAHRPSSKGTKLLLQVIKAMKKNDVECMPVGTRAAEEYKADRIVT